jgi:hypothetical protein
VGGWGERLWRILSYLCLALTALAFLSMYLWLTALPPAAVR